MQVIQKIKFLLHRSLISGSSDPGSGNRLRCSRSTYIKNQRNVRIIGSVSLILLLTLTAFTLRPVSVSTDSAEAEANPATTTLNIETSGNTAILDITPSSASGTFSSSDNSGTSLAFNVSTNNITGYNLSISHGSSTTPAPLVDENLPSGSTTNDSNSLASLPAGTSITDSDFNTSTYVGYYGYRPSMLNSQSNSNYIPAPTTSSTTLNKTTQANTASDEYTIALGANIDYTKSAGTYTNTFILTAVANNVAYTINYLDNTGTGGTTGTDVSNLPAAESASEATASSFTLSSAQPTRTGYTFAGWCDGTVTHNATGTDTCAGTTYQAGSTYSFANPSSTSTNVANLYAMWNVKTYSLAITFAGSASVPVTKTSATANIDQSTGIASSTYANNLATKDTVTVPGASELTIELNYSMETSYDYLYIFKGTYTGDVSKNMSAGQLYTYNTPSGSSGQYATYNTTTITVPGDTVTFAFYSDGSAAFYGYYAKVTGNINVSSVSNVKVCKTAGNCSGGDLMGTVSTSGSSVSGLTYGVAYYLYPTFSSGYTFSSWTKTSSTGTLSSVTTTNPTFTMGAGDGAVTITGETDKIYMQDMTASQCTTTAQTVYDKRDGQAYLVQQLADGKCWLLDNLRLGYAGFASGVTYLNSTNTNTTKFIATSTFNGWKKTSLDSWTAPMINTTLANTVNTDSSLNWGNGSHKYGVYYNYCAATMQSYCYAYDSGTGDASEDVCPKGWRMPTGGPSGEYRALCTAVKGSACSNGDTSANVLKLREVLSTPLSGWFGGSSASDQGSNGRFWSSTYYDGSYMYSLYVRSSDVSPNVYPWSDDIRRYGYSVRCVLETRTIADATYMQDVTSGMVANTSEGATATLRDKRDNQYYTVAKINGNLWMTQNLRFSGSNIDSTNTNINATKTISWSDLTSGVSYDAAKYHNSGNTTYGYWYNYAGASAMTITGDSNSTNATYDICPKGWRLPTNSEFSGITSSSSAFSPVAGGQYNSGNLNSTGYGLWWSATAYDSTFRSALRWNGSSLDVSVGIRDFGNYVRCIRSS